MRSRTFFTVCTFSFALFSLIFLWAPQASAGCGITIRASNSSSNLIDIDWYYSKVKTKGGWWKRLKDMCDYGETADEEHLTYVQAGESVSIACELDFGCSTKRQYRIYIKNIDSGHTDDAYDYYPSSSSYTTSTTINLGDLAEHFE